jgi:hypothetical protein
LWKFCPYTNKEPTTEILDYLEYVNKLEFLVEWKMASLKQDIEKEARIIEDEYEKDVRDKLRKEHEIREKEKRVHDLLLKKYLRNLFRRINKTTVTSPSLYYASLWTRNDGPYQTHNKNS